MKTKLAETISLLRARKRLSQDELAKSLNVTRQTISCWERGVSEPSIQDLEKLSEILEVDYNALITGEIPPARLKRVPLTPLSLALEITAFLALLSIFIAVGVKFSSMPETIPTHFNALGAADDWGSRNSIWIVPCVAAGIYLLISVVGRFPQVMNLPVKITPQNQLRVYKIIGVFIALIKICLIFLFGGTAIATAYFGKTYWWTLAASLGLLIIVTIIFAVALVRCNAPPESDRK